MTDIISPVETAAAAYFCPQCSTPVEVPVLLISNPVSVMCGGCGWTGDHTQLAATAFKHGFVSDSEIAETMVREVRNVLAKVAAKAYGSFLVKWGFIDGAHVHYQLATYLQAIAKATVTAIIETRKKLTEEKAHGG